MRTIHRITTLFLTLYTLFALASCRQETDFPSPLEEGEVVLSDLNDGCWTYFSFASGAVVGTSVFMSEEEDKAWSRRTDWDFAICGEFIKTNSGTSGIGKGGVFKDESSNFSLLETAPSDGYLEDKIQMSR